MNEGIQNVTVFPYTQNFAPYMTPYGQRLLSRNGIHVDSLVAPKGFGFRGRDGAQADKRDPLDYPVHSDLCDAIIRSDALLILDCQVKGLSQDVLANAAKDAINMGKNVFFSMHISAEEEQRWHKLASENNVQVMFLAKDRGGPEANFSPRYTGEALDRPSPSIVMVGEICCGLHGTDVALALKDHFATMGYKAQLIMPGVLPATVGAFTMESLWDAKESIPGQIMAINRWLRAFCQAEDPDVVIIQIPGDMVALNERVETSFGTCAYTLTQAVEADAFVLCMPMDTIDTQRLSDLGNLMKYRFALETDGLFISNKVIDGAALTEYDEISYIPVGLDRAEQYINDVAQNAALSTYSLRHIEELCKMIEGKLTGYGIATAI